MKINLQLIVFLLLTAISVATGQHIPSKNDQIIPLEKDEYWWGGFVSEGHTLPFSNSTSAVVDLYGENKNNQVQPLIISNHGRYVWSEKPFAFEFKGSELIISSTYDTVYTGKAGNTLSEAYKFVNKKFFPPSKKMPDELLFTQPQWNTWIELTYNQNQEDILKYARGILDHGFAPGVLMIDDTWQEDYGIWEFHPGRFPDPKAMMDSLHQMGFKVMLWICPFVSPDSPPYRELKKKKALLLQGVEGKDISWKEATTEPAMVQWWNGVSAVLDFTNPEAVKWFNEQMSDLKEKYGVDGYKLDAGDAPFYTGDVISYEKVLPNKHTELFGQFGLEYPLNEYRAMWKMAGQPLAQRLWDKGHSWEDLQKLVPQILLQGLEGYAFTCPDMIGGGDFTSFLDLTTLDQDLVVRSAQCHALMPMMQFSAAPWRVLDEQHLDAVKKAVQLREQMVPIIMNLAKQSAQTGEPIVRHMEYVFPKQGFENVEDQFMLGDKIMVAPLLEKGKDSREVMMPKGKWKSDDGKIINGPSKIVVNVPIDRLPFFQLIEPKNKKK